MSDTARNLDAARSQRILVVEDDEGIRCSLRLALRDEGYIVDDAADSQAALDILEEQPADLLLIDVVLPGLNGLDLCRVIRRSSAVPIIMVTARDDSHDVVAGLEAGADDYVTKPFNVKELAARIRSLLRRTMGVYADDDGGPMVFGDLELSPEEGVVRQAGEVVDLTTTEFKLLCELADHSRRVLSREQLLSSVWGYDYYGDVRVVDAHIRRLRTKIEADPAEPRYVHTVRGLGYKFDPTIEA